MTDTRKEYQDWLDKCPLTLFGGEFQVSELAWHACQSLNDKRIENYKSAYETWQDKTEWVQETAKANELGLHRADVLKKRIEQLLAVIAKKDEALQACSDAMEYMSEYDIPLTLAEDTDKALALQPADVELVEVGRWVDEGNEYESDFYPISYCGREGSGDMCYIIKEKAKQ